VSAVSPRILALDQGTQSARALVFDTEGHLIAKAKVPVEAYFSRHPGWAEQDADHFWDAITRACRELWAQSDVTPRDIQAVTLTTQRGTIVPVDDRGRPLRPAISWLDQRRAERLPTLPRPWRFLFRLPGLTGAVQQFRQQAESNWLREHEPDLWRRTRKLLLLSGYLTWRLTGLWTDSTGCQVGYLPFDFKRHAWARAGDWRWPALGLEPEMLPELVAPGERLGQITPEAAEATGIPEGLPVVAAAADKACEVLGSGALTADTACLSFGTTATANLPTRDYFEAIPLLPAYPAAVPGLWCSEVQIFRGFWMVEWFRRELGAEERRMAEERGVEPETVFDEFAERVPPGSMGLTLQPYWSPGARDPGPEAKGAIIGFGELHGRAHIYRAILEGLVYALREGCERIERRGGVRIERLRASGGGSQSDAALRITADVFRLPVERPHTYETSGLGAAMTAAVGLGLQPDHATAVARMTGIGERFEPDPERHRLYERLYRSVYQRMYPRLRPLYRAIREITGYPP